MATTKRAHWAGVGILMALAADAVLPTWGDLITLKDGRTLSGTMSRRGDVVTIQNDDGTLVKVKPDDVLRTTLVSHVTPEEAANSEWTRRAALVRQAADLQTIVDLHRTFLEKYGDSAISVTVRESLGDYLSLQKQHGVKFRGRWMPEAQVAVTLRQWQEAAAPATALYRSGQLRGALEASRKVSSRDDANPDALAVAGLASFRLSDLQGAADYFSSLAEADPGNVLAENNLGVILFSLKREPESLVHYTKALDAIPLNRLVADNIAEAMHAYTGSKTAPVYEHLVRQYAQAESRLEAEMAKAGMYRYGSTWVTAAQQSQLNANLQAIKGAMARLDTQYRASQADAQATLDQLKQATDDYNATLASLQYLNSGLLENGGDSTALAQRAALAADLERLRQRKAALETQRDALVSGTPQLFAEAARLKASLAEAQQSQYSGIQRIMDLGEAEQPPAPVPVKMPAPPTLVATTLVPQPLPPVVLNGGPDPYQQIYNAGNSVVTPFFLLPPRNDGRHHDRDHGGRGDHDGTHLEPGPIQPVNPTIVAPQGPVGPSFGAAVGGSGRGSGSADGKDGGNGR